MELLPSDDMKIKNDEYEDPRLPSINSHDSLSEFTDMVFVDTTSFPQEIDKYILSHQDELDEQSIFTEYYPFIGLSTHEEYNNLPDPQMCYLMELCKAQLAQLVDYLDIP